MSTLSPIRELTAHRINGLNEALRVFVLDGPGAGGASHDYVVLLPMSREQNDAYARGGAPDAGAAQYDMGNGDTLWVNHHIASIWGGSAPVKFFWATRLSFQNGPIKEAGVNGISQEALIAVLLDRLEGFQSGQYACRDNQLALDHLQYARLVLHKRAMDRAARGVEGTNAK